jgi:hypothetical protein
VALLFHACYPLSATRLLSQKLLTGWLDRRCGPLRKPFRTPTSTPSKTPANVRSATSFSGLLSSWNQVFLVLVLAPGHQLLLCLDQGKAGVWSLVTDVAGAPPLRPPQVCSVDPQTQGDDPEAVSPSFLCLEWCNCEAGSVQTPRGPSRTGPSCSQ